MKKYNKRYNIKEGEGQIIDGDRLRLNRIPQIISIVSISRGVELNLVKAVLEYLGVVEANSLYLNIGKEIVITSEGDGGDQVLFTRGSAICLPGEVIRKLELKDKALVGFVQRSDAVAIKKVDIVERKGERARTIDYETAYNITRLAETNPMPNELLPKMMERYQGFRLKYNVGDYLKGRRTYEAWKARKLLGINGQWDEGLREELIQDRLGKQGEDGSWEGRITTTAKVLMELAELGMRADAMEIMGAIKWLMDRPQSPSLPGMFFLTDEQVKTRKLTIKPSELGNNLLGFPPCGLRMMLPTSLALEALSRLNCEANERVRRAMQTLMSDKWCEAYRLRASWHRPCEIAGKEPYSIGQIEEIEDNCICQFRYGGMSSIKDLEGTKMLRIGHNHAAGVDEYTLRMPRNLHGCGWRIIGALVGTKDEKARRLGEAHLWRLAGRQHSPDGAFVAKGNEKYLGFFARHDHPISKVVIFRSLPWIVENQNEDGSWGGRLNKDRGTLAVIEALKRVKLI